jgi:hypothetical protein
MIYKLESIDRTIAAILRNLGLGQEQVPFDDFIEWIADGLEHIGSFGQYTTKQAFIIVEDYQGFLPCDFMELIEVMKGCSICPPPGDGFWDNSLMGALTKAGVNWDLVPALTKFNLTNAQGITTATSSFSQLSNFLHLNTALVGTIGDNKFTNNDYNIQNNVITTSFQYGIIKMQYLAMPVDDRGFPMVPDNVSFRDALYWKIAYHLSMRCPDLLKNDRMKDMEYCYSKWDWYCGQARAEANMPNVDAGMRLKNNFLRLIKDPHLDRNRFAGNGRQDFIVVDKNN